MGGGGGGGLCPRWGWGSALDYVLYAIYICYIFDNIVIHVWTESGHGLGRMKGQGGGGVAGPCPGGGALVLGIGIYMLYTLYIYAIYLITL